MRAALLVNPAAGGGRAARKAPELAARLREWAGDDIALHVTEEPGHAVQIAREVARDATPVLFVLGGDGTVHEALNGLVDPLGGAAPPTILAPLDGGTGSDARGNLTPGLTDDEILQRALAGRSRLADVGRARFLRLEWGSGELGALPVRLFLNAANVGVAAQVAARVQGRMPFVPRGWAFPLAIVAEILRGGPRAMSLALDGAAAREVSLWNLTVANGRRIGGGLPIAPDAVLDDGLFDVVTVGAMSRFAALSRLPRLRAGTHEALSGVAIARAAAVHVGAAEALTVEADGEWIGETPCAFDVLPRAVRVVA